MSLFDVEMGTEEPAGIGEGKAARGGIEREIAPRHELTFPQANDESGWIEMAVLETEAVAGDHHRDARTVERDEGERSRVGG